MVVVLEGVLCDVIPQLAIRKKGIRRREVTEVVGHHLSWHDLPLKRLSYLITRWADADVEIITFTSDEVAESASDYLDRANISYSGLTYEPFDTWVSLLRYQPDVTAIYDSDEQRAEHYGQRGHIVIRGEDF